MSIIDDIRIKQTFDPDGENGGYNFEVLPDPQVVGLPPLTKDQEEFLSAILATGQVTDRSELLLDQQSGRFYREHVGECRREYFHVVTSGNKPEDAKKKVGGYPCTDRKSGRRYRIHNGTQVYQSAIALHGATTGRWSFAGTEDDLPPLTEGQERFLDNILTDSDTREGLKIHYRKANGEKYPCTDTKGRKYRIHNGTRVYSGLPNPEDDLLPEEAMSEQTKEMLLMNEIMAEIPWKEADSEEAMSEQTKEVLLMNEIMADLPWKETDGSGS